MHMFCKDCEHQPCSPLLFHNGIGTAQTQHRHRGKRHPMRMVYCKWKRLMLEPQVQPQPFVPCDCVLCYAVQRQRGPLGSTVSCSNANNEHTRCFLLLS